MTEGQLSGLTEEDHQICIDFLNSVAKYATYQVTTEQLIGHFRLLSRMQQQVLPRIKANILEVKKVHEPEKKPSSRRKTSK